MFACLRTHLLRRIIRRMRADCQEESHTEDAGALQEGKRGNMSEGAHGFNEFSQGQKKGFAIHSEILASTYGESARA